MGLFNFKKEEGSDSKVTEDVKVDIPAEAEATEDDSGNEYTELFSKEANKSLNTEDSKVLDSVVSTSDKDDKSILGIDRAASIDTSSFIDQDYHLKKRLAFVRGVFFFLLFSSVALFGYFFIELNPEVEVLNQYLGRNTTQTLEDLEKKLVSDQTKLNEYRFLSSKVYLDDFSYQSDKFMQHYDVYSSAADSVTGTQAESRLIDLQNKLTTSFEKAKKKLLAKLWVDPTEEDVPEDQKLMFETGKNSEFIALLQNHFSERMQLINNNAEKAAAVKAELVDEINQTMSLIGNVDLNVELRNNDFSDLSYKDVTGVIDKMNSITENALSHIYKIKSSRIKWSGILREIDLVARTTEPTYDNGLYNDLGGIKFSSYQFDSRSGRIIVTGEVKTKDASNFSLMATLIDNFEKSKMFKDVGLRSFSKVKSTDSGYTSSLKLDFLLQKKGELDEEDAGALLDGDIETLSIDEDEEKVGVKKKFKIKVTPRN